MIIFESARLKLTAWYLLIIMFISTAFSVGIYRSLTSELNRIERMHRLRIERRLPERLKIIPSDIKEQLSPSLFLDPQLITETKNRLKIILIMINLAILSASAAAGYFLAGRTLKPIEEMVEDQKRFVADASHELRTPLTAIKTETEVALRDKKLNFSAAKKLLISNLEEINKLKSLTDYFLTLSRYQNADTNITLETFNLAHVAKEAVSRLKTLAEGKKIKVVKNFDDIHIEANKISIVELITLLLDNAIKYSHKNGKVNISLKAQRNYALVKVQDFGIGIKPKDLPCIFNRFYRAEISRTKTDKEGYGLGLSIAKSIVDRHHGKIEVSSTPGKGSTFTVQLPIKA